MLCIISIELWIGGYVVAERERRWWSGGKMCQSYGKCFFGGRMNEHARTVDSIQTCTLIHNLSFSTMW